MDRGASLRSWFWRITQASGQSLQGIRSDAWISEGQTRRVDEKGQISQKETIIRRRKRKRKEQSQIHKVNARRQKNYRRTCYEKKSRAGQDLKAKRWRLQEKITWSDETIKKHKTWLKGGRRKASLSSGQKARSQTFFDRTAGNPMRAGQSR